MARQFQHRILQHIRHRAYQPQQLQALASDLGVEDKDYDAFVAAVEELADDGQVLMGASDTVALPSIGREVTGKFKRNDRGFGFVIPDTRNSHGDLFVGPRDTNGALTGDRVRAEVFHRGGGRGQRPDRMSGRITEIIQRGDTRFPGNLVQRSGRWMVDVDGTALPGPVLVRDPGAKHAAGGAKVVVELTHFPEGDMLAEGVIVEVLGEIGEPEVETVAICRAFGLAEKFPEAAMKDARQCVQKYQKLDREGASDGREDLRDQFTLTIDPPDAQDFDDAISIAHDDAGWELGVHIADVSTFVTGGSALDEEAYERGNSTYLPRKVIPMLPEVLSNGLCSLQPSVARLAMSVFIRYGGKGQVKSSRFAQSVIQSDHRLTYLEAQALIDGKGDKEARAFARSDVPYTKQLRDTLSDMEQLSKIVRQRRKDGGMISLDLPEVELIHDDTGRVVDAKPEDDAYTHQLIETFMVEANEAVARVFADLNVPLIRRIHPDPGAHDTEELRRFARVAGFNIPSNPSRRELQTLLEATRGKPSAMAVHLAVLKTLTKAEYAPALIGHFALASEHYTHFTSPIRRYPDLTVHRALAALINVMGSTRQLPRNPQARRRIARQLSEQAGLPSEADLQTLGRHCSATERNSEAAERELRDFLVLQLLEQHIGDEFAGTITGVTGFGVFIQIDRYLVEGLVRNEKLPGAPADRWNLNEQTGAVVAQRSGRSITIGDQFKVRINRVDLSRRELDLHIIEAPAAHPAKQKRKQGTSKTKSARPTHKAKGNVKGKAKRGGRRRR